MIGFVGQKAVGSIEKLGADLLFFAETLNEMKRGPLRRHLIFKQMMFIGNESLLIVMTCGFFIGAVFSLQIGVVFAIFGAEGMMGAANAKALARELSPLVTAFLLAGRAGAAITAEISTMKVSEQVDAMESMGVSPVSYLVVPRFIAAILMTPLLVSIFNLTGQLGSLSVGIYIFDVDQGVFFNKFVNMMKVSDIWGGYQKAVVFGGIISLLACRFGLHASGGAKGVGKATTNAVVTMLLVILAVDFLITFIQTKLIG
jgi:phospholipid/cholesterol/gamma-HCH transport system permease protein